MEVVTFGFFAMTAYKFQPYSNNPYLELSRDEAEDLTNVLLHNEDQPFAGDTETVLDLIEHDYSASSVSAEARSKDGQKPAIPSGPNSINPNLLSRKQVTLVSSEDD